MRFLAVGECMIELSGAGEGLWRSGFAGDTFNTAWYLRAMAPAAVEVGYYTVVGRDPMSDQMLDFIAGAGILTDGIRRHPNRVPGLYAIALRDGERSFTYWRDTSAARTLADDPVALEAAFRATDVIYFSGITLAILDGAARRRFFDALGAARAIGRRVVFDPNLRPRLWASEEELRAVVTEAAGLSNIVLPSYDDEAAQFGDESPAATAARYLAAGAEEVLVKNGGAEMVHGAADRPARPLPALERVAPVDTTGAGDSFNGGYLAARLLGATVEEAVVRGHAVAMRVVGHRGALVPFALLGEGPRAAG